MRISDWSSDVCSSDLWRHSAEQHFHALGEDDAFGEFPRLFARRKHQRLLRGREFAEPRDLLDFIGRSEERRLGEECVSTSGSRWSRYHYKNKNIPMSKSSTDRARDR